MLRARLILIFLAFCNLTGSMMVYSSAADMAKRFGNTSIMPLFSTCLVLFSIVVKIINMNYLMQVKHKTKILFNTISFLFGTIFIYFGTSNKQLSLCLIGSIFFGISKTFGEVILQGFIKGFPPNVIGGFTLGTGFAGIFISAYYLTMKIYNFNVEIVFLIIFPLYFLYYLSFSLLVDQKIKYDEIT